MLSTISLNALLSNLHYNLWNSQYEQCKADLIAADNYKSGEQAFECASNASLTVKVLGVILWSE